MKKVLVICGLVLIIATSAAFIVIQCLEMSGRSLFRPAKSHDSGSDKPPIKAIMIHGFRDSNTSLLGRIGKALQENEILWNDVQRDADEIVALAKELKTFSPSKGGRESWESLTGRLIQSATGLASAAQRKDKETSNVERKTIVASCAACHDAHR